MKPVCQVCANPRIDEINKALESGVSCSEIAMMYFCSDQAVRRHKRNHLRRNLNDTN